jgi:type IV pilus assembly protein PilP
MKRNSSALLRWAAVTIAAIFLLPAAAPVLCADTGDAQETGVYRYAVEGKPDPFTPFIDIPEETGKKERTGTTETHRETVPLAPLQKFGLDELRLTGIIWSSNKKIAVVQTPDGKRHTLRRGTPLGINGGKVATILSDGVVVVEKIKDLSGNVRTERVVLALKKNGVHP